MSTPDTICKDGASKSNDDVCEMNDQLRQLSTTDNEDSISICANCGKEGDINNICNKCKMVKYCNAACKKKHRHKHKKQCEEHVRLAAERAAELHDIELFKEPPSLYGDCPICFLRMPSLYTGYKYQTCCGNVICSGCRFAPVYDNQGNIVTERVCPFCRTPVPSSQEEIIERVKKRVDGGDDKAMHGLAMCYREGTYGLPQDYTKALELYHRAGNLGSAESYNNIGVAYDNGRGVEVDEKRAIHYFELAAMQGDSTARYNLGEMEEKAGNIERALKHYMIAVKDGDTQSLKQIQLFYSNGQASKEDYTKALQSYQAYLGEIKSKQRDEAAAAREDINSNYCYY